ncbi:Ribosomal RNA small subunit methyltransferase F [uncultured archaeon]|nr:Ribosomal RNA small subunit methyltransferase F [uncultured archaeon]
MPIPLKFLNESEKEKLVKQLEEQFGIKKIPWKIARFGKERIIIFSGDISDKEIFNLDKFSRIEGIGLYFAKIDEKTKDIRLSIEGAQLLRSQITKNIFELDEEQAEKWMMGQELNVATGKKGFFIMKFQDDFFGTGKISENKISNFIPKSRRLKYKESRIE